MARALRIEYAGALYHVMARGNQGHSIFFDDKDRSRFLETLGEACEKTGWAIHAYVLMGNHYHFMKLKARLGGIVAGKKRESHSGGAKRAHGRKAAEEMLKKALEHLGVSQRELQESPKGAPEKTALAWWLRKRTSVSLLWVSQELGMGHYTRVSKAVSWVEQKPAKKLKELKSWLLELEKRDV